MDDPAAASHGTEALIDGDGGQRILEVTRAAGDVALFEYATGAPFAAQ